MPRIKIAGPTYTSQSVNADCQKTMNWYPEAMETSDANAPIVLYPTPGLNLFSSIITPFGWGTNWGGNWGAGFNP